MASYQDLIDGLREVSETENLEEQRKIEERPKQKKKLQDELRDSAYSYAIENLPGFDKEKKDLTREDIENYNNQRKLMATARASKSLTQCNLDDLLDKKIKNETLEKLAGETAIVAQASGEDREILASYKRYKDLADFISHYEKEGNPRNEAEAEQISRAAIKGYGKAQVEALKARGYEDIDVLEQGKALAQQAVQRGFIGKDGIMIYVSEGLKEELKERKKEYEKAGDTVKAVKKTVKKLITGNPEEFRIAKDFLYAAETGDEAYIKRRYKSAA